MNTKLVDAIDELLPQTQCTRCGYPSCREYAMAIENQQAEINQCPPGGNEGIISLAKLLNKPILELNPVNGTIKPRQIALIDEDACIGCTLCIKACPVDAIVGSNKMMHTVIADECSGCDLCIPACPVDCIEMVEDPLQEWNSIRRNLAKQRFDFHNERKIYERREREERLQAQAELLKKVRSQQENTPTPADDKSSFIAQIMKKAGQK